MSLNSPLVSVIVPCFNYAHFLPETLESVRAQTLEDWECIVVDDGSTDDSVEVARSFEKRDARIRVVARENGGLPVARNTGLEEARGRFVQFLDADDLIEREKLAVQSGFLLNHGEVDVVYGDACFFESDSPQQMRRSLFEGDRDWMPRVSGGADVMVPLLLKRNIMPVSSALVRREWIERVGGFRRDLPGNEDWELWLRLAVRGAVFAWQGAPDTRTSIRSHSASMSRDFSRQFASEIAWRESWRSEFPNDSWARFNEERIVRAKALKAHALMKSGRRREAFAEAKSGLRDSNRFKWICFALAATLLDSPRARGLWGRLRSRSASA